MPSDSDIQLLIRALEFEKLRAPRAWEKAEIDASQGDINRFLAEQLIECRNKGSHIGPGEFGPKLYKLTAKGRVMANPGEVIIDRVTANDVLEAMSFVVGFDDIKRTIARAIEVRPKQVHFLLEGPPASVKSTILEIIRNVVPSSYLVFGSRTSGRGLSDLLLDKRPTILLADETDKMRHDVFSLLLGLLEAGEIIETKAGNTRRSKLDTMVIAACNSSKKMPPEFLSRFGAGHFKLPNYNRDEFVAVVCSMLNRAEQCPLDLAEMLAVQVFDNNLGDVRLPRSVWKLMEAPTAEEARRVLAMSAKYSVVGERSRPKAAGRRLV